MTPEQWSDELLRRLEERGLQKRFPDGTVRLTAEAVEIARKGRRTRFDVIGGALALAKAVGLDPFANGDTQRT
jgi:hypothetical protein